MDSIQALRSNSLRAEPAQPESEPNEAPHTPQNRIRRALFPSATPTTGGSSGSGQ